MRIMLGAGLIKVSYRVLVMVLEPSRQRLLLLDPWRPLLEGLHLHELLLRDSAQPKPGLILGALGARVVAQVRYFGL